MKDETKKIDDNFAIKDDKFDITNMPGFVKLDYSTNKTVSIESNEQKSKENEFS